MPLYFPLTPTLTNLSCTDPQSTSPFTQNRDAHTSNIMAILNQIGFFQAIVNFQNI